MGNDISGGTYQELEGMKKYTGFSPGQVEMIREKFDLMADEDLTLNKESFIKLMKVKEAEADKIFEFFDIDQSNRIDSYEFICGLALLAQTNLKGKAELIFNLYDFDRNRTITSNELVILIKTTMTSLNAMASKPEATIQEAEQKQKEILQNYDTNKDGTISLKEFQSFISKDSDILKMLYSYGLISKEDLRPDFGCGGEDMPDCDSDLENEIKKAEEERDERVERITNGIEHNEVYEEDEEKSGQQALTLNQEEDDVSQAPWQKSIKNLVPSEYKPTKGESNPPTVALDIDYVHGFRCFDTRNNLKYNTQGELIYHTAAIGIVLDTSSNSQQYFLEHNDDIVCLDAYEDKVVTGQLGLNPMICIWDTKTMTSQIVFKGVLKNGIGNVCFSNDGKKIAACALDEEHTVAIYDVEKAIHSRQNPGKKQIEDGLMATGKLTKAPIFDLRFDLSDKTIIAAGLRVIYFITFDGGIMKKTQGIWDKNNQQLQSVLCVGFVETHTITGMFQGQLLIWNKNRLTQQVQGHQGPVTAMVTRKGANKGIITAGRDGVVYIWDHNIKNPQKVDIKDFRFFSNRIVCIAEQGNKIAIGTRSSEIAEFSVGGNIKPKTVVKGHFDGELWGLAVHTKSQQFFTVGEDNLLACWDIKKRCMLLGVKLDFPAKALHTSANGKYLAVGCTNGSVLIVDPKSLVVTFTFKDRDREVSCIKFSPDNELLAVAYGQPSCEILIYNVRNHFKNENKLRGSTSRVTHLDFSENSKTLMCNNARYELLFFDLQNGKLNTKLESLRDEKWATWTCIFGWQCQGIWPPCSMGLDINSVDRSIGTNSNVLVSADDFSKIKLFKYPSAKPHSSFVKYSGHSAQITNVRFSNDNDFIISTGGQEKSIIVWKYNYDSLGQKEADEINLTIPEEVEEPLEDEEEKGDNNSTTKPYHGQITSTVPNDYTANPKKDNRVPDQSLQLSYVHGFRSFYHKDECRGMCKYLANGKVAFGAAGLGVVQDPKNKNTQTFFQKHKEDVVAMAIHPKGSIIATGQMALGGDSKVIDIFIWDAETKAVLGHINDFHRKAIVKLEFSPDGTYLLTAGQDEDNSIAIYDWSSSRIVATSKVDKAKVNDASWKDNTEFVTVGSRHVKFWILQGRNIKCKQGIFNKKFEPQVCSTYAFNSNICVTGGVDGNIYTWNSNYTVNQPCTQAHKGKVGQLINVKGSTLLSGGYDGKVIMWALQNNNQLQQQQEMIDIRTTKITQFDASIVSLDYKNDMLLIGTKESEIFETKQGGTSFTLLQQAHFEGELWGLATSPKDPQFITCGGDKFLRLWDIETHKQIAISKQFENDIRACDWSANHIVIGDVKGYIYLINPQNLEQLDKKGSKFTTLKAKKSQYWIEDIKISPQGDKVAFGAHGSASHVEIWEIQEGGKQFSKQNIINAGLTSSLNHLDWSDNGQVLAVNSTAYELKFISTQGKGKDISAGSSRDQKWHTITCTYMWFTQGIFPRVDGLEVNSVCRSNQKDKYVIATGDDFGRVNLYQYPAVAKKQVHKTYLGHSSRITRTRFTIDDRNLVTIGGQDKTILVWDTDINAPKEEDENLDQQFKSEQDGDDEGNEIQVLQPKKWKKGADKYGKGQTTKKQKAQNDDDIFAEEEVDNGDEFSNVKPWLGAIKEPTSYYKDPLNQNKKPPISMNLDFVFGYSANKSKNNVRYLKNGGIVYFAASLGIIYDTNLQQQNAQQSSQKFFNQHTDDITAMDLHPDGIKVATGQLGKKATIYVWDSSTLHSICAFKGNLSNGIASLSFTPSGDKLAAVAIDNYHEIAIFDILAKSKNGGVLITKVKSGPDTVLDIKWKNDTEFATAGLKHMKIWTIQNTNLKAKRGIFGKVKSFNLLTVSAVNDDFVTGAQDGSIYVFKGNQIVNNKKNHEKAVESLSYVNGVLITGGRDGKVFILDKNYNVLVRLTEENFKLSFNYEIKAIHLSSDNRNLIVGTAGSEIYEFTTKDAKIGPSTKYQGGKRVMSGHFSPNKQTENELWGLTAFGDNEHLATCSDDGTLRVWSVTQRKCIKQKRTNLDEKSAELPLDHRTNDLQDCAKGRAIACSNNGEMIAVGFKDGVVKIYDKELDQKNYIKCAKECISDIKFCPNDELIAIGSHDNAIYIYSKQEMKSKFKPLRKHSSYITRLDFSDNANFLHSNCGAYELLFWDVSAEKGGKQVTNGATQLRDTKWHTLTTPLSWPTQGIWPEYADGTDINAVDRSHATYSGQDGPPDNYHLLATGDDNATVKVFRYPCVKKNSQFVEGKGHSSHVTQVKWSNDDRYLFTIGGGDNCVFVWNITKNK